VSSSPPADPALVDLLAALAYGELSGFDHLADDARLAPSLAGRAAMSAMAAVEFGHFQRLSARLRDLGVAAEDVMEPFVAALETYHDLTAPVTWLESVVKAYVGHGMAADFYREVAKLADPATRELIDSVLVDAGRAEFAVSEVHAAVAAQPSVADRLALYARRLVGEAISQTQHVLADRDALTYLLVSGAGDIQGLAGLIERITSRHEERMKLLGLPQ
jgi:tRNA-(MS[2]IO[6]A)-hydroxylase MiaE-like protein